MMPVLFLLLFSLVLLVVQYAAVIVMLYSQDFKTKKEVKNSLIPFYFYALLVKEIYNDLKEKYKGIKDE